MPTRESIKVYRAGLSFSKKLDGSWKFETTDLDALARSVGDEILTAFLRCFVWADRLLSLTAFGYYDQSSKNSLAYDRNLHFIAWTGGGILYEAAEAVQDLENAGIANLLRDQTEWKKLRKMARRWRKHRLLIRVRQNLSFHVDGKLIARGLAKARVADERYLVLGGDSRQPGHTHMRLGMELLVTGLGASVRLSRVIGVMSHDHAQFTRLLQLVFREALRGCGVM